MTKKIENPQKQVPQTKEMNDRDYLNDVLQTTKNLSDNLSIAINEASNTHLKNEIQTMFSETKTQGRKLYDLMFEYGWYKLEKEDVTKINEKLTELQQKYQELN